MQDLAIALLFGFLGGVVLELVATYRHLSTYGHYPWSTGEAPKPEVVDGVLRRYETWHVFLAAFAIRAAVGGIVAMAVSTAGTNTPLASLVIGVGAYGLLDRWAASSSANGGELSPPVDPASGPLGAATDDGLHVDADAPDLLVTDGPGQLEESTVEPAVVETEVSNTVPLPARISESDPIEERS